MDVQEYLFMNDYDWAAGSNYDVEYRIYRESLKPTIEPHYFFITVNPKPDVKLDLFMKLLVNFCKRKPITDYIYTIEQRGETIEEVGKGFHAHILVSWDPAMSKRVRQFCGETFKRVIGSNNNHIININKIPKEYFKDKIDYMTGLKWDPEKDQKLKIDKIFREQNNILLLYKNDSLSQNSS
jgi:hypothetical protein